MPDANIIISALVRDSHVRHFLLLSGHSFYTPEFVFEEISEHMEELKEKTWLSEDKIKEVLEKLMIIGNIKIIPLSELAEYKERAQKISPDIDDCAYIALAMKLKCAVWLNDTDLKEKQNYVKVYSSKEILRTN